jgi:hypothetical protein
VEKKYRWDRQGRKYGGEKTAAIQKEKKDEVEEREEQGTE